MINAMTFITAMFSCGEQNFTGLDAGMSFWKTLQKLCIFGDLFEASLLSNWYWRNPK